MLRLRQTKALFEKIYRMFDRLTLAFSLQPLPQPLLVEVDEFSRDRHLPNLTPPS